MLMRTDPFRDLDRLTQQLAGTAARPALMAMDAWREQDTFVVEFDLPGVDPGSIDLDMERNVLSVSADRPARQDSGEQLAAERPRGVFRRQLILGDNLDTEHVAASYAAGVLRLEIPVAEQAKPRRINVAVAQDQATLTTGDSQDLPGEVVEGQDAAAGKKEQRPGRRLRSRAGPHALGWSAPGSSAPAGLAGHPMRTILRQGLLRGQAKVSQPANTRR